MLNHLHWQRRGHIREWVLLGAELGTAWSCPVWGCGGMQLLWKNKTPQRKLME